MFRSRQKDVHHRARGYSASVDELSKLSCHLTKDCSNNNIKMVNMELEVYDVKRRREFSRTTLGFVMWLISGFVTRSPIQTLPASWFFRAALLLFLLPVCRLQSFSCRVRSMLLSCYSVFTTSLLLAARRPFFVFTITILPSLLATTSRLVDLLRSAAIHFFLLLPGMKLNIDIVFNTGLSDWNWIHYL